MVPALPEAQEQFLYCPTQLGTTLSEGFYQAFSSGHLLLNLCSLFLWEGYLFSSKTSARTCSVQKRDKTRDVPNFPSGNTECLSPFSLLSSVCIPIQAPSVRLEGRWTREPSKKEGERKHTHSTPSQKPTPCSLVLVLE